MDEEKKVIYAIIAACIIGIFIVGFLVVTYAPTKESFSELYFEEHEKLPDKITVGEEETFAFTVVSHERNITSYDYIVSLDNITFKQGSFMLSSEESKTINVAFTPYTSSIVLADTEKSIGTNHFTVSRPVDTIDIDKVLIINPQGNVTTTLDVDKLRKSMIIDTHGNIIWSGVSKREGVKIPIPLGISTTGGQDLTTTINLDSNAKENYSFTHDAKNYVSNSPVGSDNETLSPIGYDQINYKTDVTNNYGDIQIIYEKTILKYRYEFKKVSVEVISEDETEYEIHYWAIVVQM